MTATPQHSADVVCLGESMVTFVPTEGGRLADVASFHRAIGGAESNVACTLARAGHRARWISRVGADGFGDHLVETIAAAGVDVSAVQRDPHRPTGVYFRTAGERATGPQAAPGHAEVVYYRAGSAASALSPALVRRRDVWSGRVLHLTGITGALSATCRALMRRLTHREPGRPLVSFDVNHRPALWHDTDPWLLAELARGCDLVFVGEDEAEAAWGVSDAAAIRRALPEPHTLVVKQGAAGATVFTRGGPDADGPGSAAAGFGGLGSGDAGLDGPASSGPGAGLDGLDGPRPGSAGAGAGARAGGTAGGPGAGAEHGLFVPALGVDVVAHVGAGDAFAAGFLSATLRGLPLRDRLRHGHVMAAAALTVPGDLGTPPARAHADALVALDDDAWGRLRLGPGWTAAGATQGEPKVSQT